MDEKEQKGQLTLEKNNVIVLTLSFHDKQKQLRKSKTDISYNS